MNIYSNYHYDNFTTNSLLISLATNCSPLLMCHSDINRRVQTRDIMALFNIKPN